MDLHALILRKYIGLLILSSATALYSPCLRCFSSCLFKDPPPKYSDCSDWSALTHLNQHHKQQQLPISRLAHVMHGDVV